MQTYFLGNALGSTEALTDGSGTVTGTKKYDVFGAVRSSTGSASTEYQFTGQQQNDATLGYTYLRARYYDSAIGRFISQDTHPALAAKPETLNRYTYTNNNPTNLTDPRGTYAGSWEDLLEALFQPPEPGDDGGDSGDSGDAGDSREPTPEPGGSTGNKTQNIPQAAAAATAILVIDGTAGVVIVGIALTTRSTAATMEAIHVAEKALGPINAIATVVFLDGLIERER